MCRPHRPLLAIAAAALAWPACNDPEPAGAPDTWSASDAPVFASADADGGSAPTTDAPVGQPDEGATADGQEPAADATSEAGGSDASWCQCPSQTHCDQATGLCHPDVCVKGTTTCLDLATVKVCNADGSEFYTQACQPGQVCYGGVCWDPICQPGTEGGCSADGQLLKCNSLGTDWVAYPCPAGQACSAGECRSVPPNIVMLIDTSGSMNWLDDESAPDSCWGAGCPPWDFPDCDDPANPKTRLGKVKKALTAVASSDAAEYVRLALQRFPQEGDSMHAMLDPILFCDGGYFTNTSTGLVSGDDGSHVTSAAGWFGKHLGEILLMPFSATAGTDLAALAAWFDFTETVKGTTKSCFNSDDCPGGVCLGSTSTLSSKCHDFTNPELRAIGGTPLGKSLFYAGELLRHQVLVEGKPCMWTEDCASPHHSCVSGLCHDPFAYCRDHLVLLFTDGEETENVHTDDFFHPRVQAKRLHYGLGCLDDSHCLAGATCVGGVCRPPAGAIDEAAMVCETGGLPCSSTSDCPDPCASWDTCQGECLEARVTLTDPSGSDRIADWSGAPVSVTVHVVDASGTPGANQLIAAYGGGMHFSVDLADPDALVSTVTQILGDAKDGSPCGQPQ